ncbi:MAG TPA: DegT/DnrJ/EryC1/StrS family aminotransferase [Candidatus Acidoferrales bacterium]|nr:DegT/DnrJ/EryC1/StrS family aminotransferase [Candidatus Acidoferrales bacterium]
MDSKSSDLLATVGRRPMFEERLPIVSPEGLPDDDFLRDVQQILRSRQLTNATFVRKFEEAAAEYLGVTHCVAVSSCTAGLTLTLRALDLQGEVILPSFTFHASAHSVLWNGLKPVFADCDLETFCIDPRAVKVQISSRTAAIMAVHLFGNPASVAEIQTTASDLGIPLICDAAHAFGSDIDGRRVGTFGAAEVFSFSPTKLLVAGEGGMVATRDADLARKLRAARNYGDSGNYDPELAGLNARMSEFHAALALRGLHGLDARIARRIEIRLHYERRLGAIPGISFQHISPCGSSACKDFAVLVNEGAFGQSRDWLVDALETENIQVRRYFWPPVHRQKLYCDIWDKRPLPVTDRISSSILNLPIYSTLSDGQVDKVCDAVLRSHEFANKSGFAKAQRA